MEELLERLDGWFDEAHAFCPPKPGQDLEAYQQIRKLIEGKPKVTKKFIEKWANSLINDYDILTFDSLQEGLTKMFKEAGMEEKE